MYPFNLTDLSEGHLTYYDYRLKQDASRLFSESDFHVTLWTKSKRMDDENTIAADFGLPYKVIRHEILGIQDFDTKFQVQIASTNNPSNSWLTVGSATSGRT